MSHQATPFSTSRTLVASAVASCAEGRPASFPLDRERAAAEATFSGMFPGRADPDRKQTFSKVELKEIVDAQVRENSVDVPVDLRTPVLPAVTTEGRKAADAMARAAVALHFAKTGEGVDLVIGEEGYFFDDDPEARTFGHYMEVSAFLRGFRAIAERPHYNDAEALFRGPLAVCEHSVGFVVVTHDAETDPEVEWGSPLARFGTVAECEAYIAGVELSIRA